MKQIKHINIQPTHLVAGKNVKFFVHATGSGAAPAYVQVTREPNGVIKEYALHIFEKECSAIFLKTPYIKDVPFASFMLGIVIHEILHILNNVFDFAPSFTNGVMQYVWNVTVDSHDEYKGAYWFPTYAPFINLCLSCIKHVTPTGNYPQSNLDKDLSTWYHLVRFGVKFPNADEDFFNFAVQCALPGIRGTSNDALQASYAIYEYLRMKHETSNAWKEASSNTNNGDEAITEQDMENIEAMLQVFENDKSALIRAVANGDVEILAGVQNVDITYDTSDDSFYVSTVEKFEDAIAEIANRFSKFIDAPEAIKAYDGDMGISIQEQMALYQSSFTGEDTQSYYRNIIHSPEIDVVVCHDISQSTNGFSEQFAQACIMFFAAFEKVSGVRKAYVRFNAGAKVVFDFDAPPQRAAFDPEARGGTELSPILELTGAMDWRSSNRLQFIFTDGEFYDFESGAEQVNYLREALGIHTYIIEIVGNYNQKTVLAGNFPNAYKSTLDDLSGKTMNRLIIDILKARNQIS